MKFTQLRKLSPGSKVAILSPSFAAPGVWPWVHEFGLKRLTENFGLQPIEFPTTRKVGAPAAERTRDLQAAFEDKEIEAVIATIGGDDQITYIKNLDPKPFRDNPKPFFGYSDNTHLANFLWLNGIPSYYGGSLFTEYALNGAMDDFTVEYIRKALFEGGATALKSSPVFSDQGLNWADKELLNTRRRYQESDGWHWSGTGNVEGILWGGCLESIDELLRHGVAMPSLEQFKEVVLFLETSEEIPDADYVGRVLRALGERGILGVVQGVLVGRPKAWEFNKPNSDEAKVKYKTAQREKILQVVRRYAANTVVVQNLDFGHTAPQICLPMGRRVLIDGDKREISAEF